MGFFGGAKYDRPTKLLRPSGGTGIHARLKIVFRKDCGFDSHLGHIESRRPISGTA